MLKEEIWGCFKYIGLPMETIYKLPIQDRRYFIKRHNNDTEMRERRQSGNNGERTYQGNSLNNFAINQTEYDGNSRRGK